MSMIVKRRKRQFEIPKEGQVFARLQQIKDLGIVDGNFGSKEKIAFVWQTAECGIGGEPLEVWQRLTKSLHPKSLLFKAIRQITGEDPGEEFDLQTLVGVEVTLVIEHNEAEDVTYANVAAIVRPLTEDEKRSDTEWPA